MRQGPGLLSPDMESADLEEQLRIYARDKEDSGSAYALEALKRRVPEDFQLVVDEADRRTGEIVGASPALIGDGPHESWYVPQPSIEQRWRTTRNSWRTLRLVKQALIALTPPQIRSLSAFRIRVQRISQHVVWYSAMFRAERQQTFSPLQPRPWITNTTSSSSWRAFTIRSGGRLRSEPNRPSCTIPSFGGVVQQPGSSDQTATRLQAAGPGRRALLVVKAQACPQASRRLAVRLRRRPTTKTKDLGNR